MGLRLAKNKKGTKMSVSLEKPPMPSSEEAGKSAVDYEVMLQEAQAPVETPVDENAGRFKDAGLAHGIANGEAGNYENANLIARNRAVDAAIADRPDHEINTHINDAQGYRASADRIYDKVQQTVARAEDTKR